MAKDKYETKVVTAQMPSVTILIGGSPVDVCVLCKGKNVLVTVNNAVRSIRCLEAKCGYVANYKDGKII